MSSPPRVEPRSGAFRLLTAGAAAALAAALLLRVPLELLATPGWPEADEHQTRLSEWSLRLPAVLARVPREAVLGFQPQPARAEPLDPAAASGPATDDEFERIQAVLAPRRIVASVEADFVLAHVGSLVALSRTAGFERLVGLEPVVSEWVLVEREAR